MKDRASSGGLGGVMGGVLGVLGGIRGMVIGVQLVGWAELRGQFLECWAGSATEYKGFDGEC